MRMWIGVDPSEMCRKHLLGEHVELHMLAGCIEKGKNIKTFMDKVLVDVPLMNPRHELIVEEMLKRGYKHKSPLAKWDKNKMGYIVYPSILNEVKRNRADLAARCPECAERMKNHGSISSPASA